MANIYLYKFNNYYNRQIKHLNVLSTNAIESAGGTLQYSAANIAFKWNDGVNNELILNHDIETNFSGDYCLIEDTVKGNSVWFIMEATRTRNGQCRLLLYRDLINTYYETIINAPMFIEKATLPSDNDLIFNSENMSFNQIKTEEYELSESSWGVGCLVAYLASKNDEEEAPSITGEHTFQVGFATTADIPVTPDVTLNMTLSEFTSKYQNCQTLQDYTFETDYRYGYAGARHRVKYNRDRQWDALNYNDFKDSVDHPYSDSNRYVFSTIDVAIPKLKEALATISEPNLVNMICANVPSGGIPISNPEVEDTVMAIVGMNGKTIKFSDGTIIHIDDVVFEAKYYCWAVNSSSNLGTSINSAIASKNAILSQSGNPTYCRPKTYKANFTYSNVSTTRQIKQTYRYQYPNHTAIPNLSDAPYKMIVVPVKLTKNFLDSGELDTANLSIVINNVYTSTQLGVAKGLMNSIANDFGSWVYDIQYLPYIPTDISSNIYIDDGLSTCVNTGQREADSYFTVHNAQGQVKCVAFFGTISTFKKTISINNGSPITIKDYKVESQTDMARLVSPSFASAFEFNAAKNGGLSRFEVLCTYKPFNPYINVKPVWNRLYKGKYGEQFLDNRGLVCADDFSMPIVNSKWTEYELNNKNYEKSFNRQIQNMEVNNSIANQQAGWQVAAGTVSGAVSGATAGALAGGGVIGAAAGAVVGSGTALGAGLADIQNQKKLQAETIDYTKDQFGYQLGNIKAMPNVLAKTGSSVANTKYFPVLELYTCTEVEKQALINKIKYNGMTVGVIDKMINYIYDEPSYIKGKLIRLEDTDVDFHELNTIAEELNKGVFI